VAGDPVFEERGDRADADRLADGGAIITWVWADVEELHDRFARRRRLGIDEISYKRGHRYLTVVVDHDSGRLVWAAPGRDKATLAAFFDALGQERCAAITHVSADGADWIDAVAAERCPNAVRCADPFHIVRWATDALDDVRRQAWNEARGAVSRRRAARASGHAKALKHARFALCEQPREPHQPTAGQADLGRQDRPATAPGLPAQGGSPAGVPAALRRGRRGPGQVGWLGRRCRIPAFVHLQRRIVKHKASILAAIKHGLSNGRIESVNTKIRLITRVAFGFRSPEALIALALLNLGGHRPTLPGRK
jgi:transposase